MARWPPAQRLRRRSERGKISACERALNDYRVNLSGPFEWRLYAFIFAVAILLGFAFSLPPAIQAARQVFAPGLRVESRSATAAGRLVSLRSALILVQVALSLPLLFTAALLVLLVLSTIISVGHQPHQGQDTTVGAATQ